MKSFKVNDFITLKLENKKTVIYVAGKLFQQCKFLLLSIPIDKVSMFNGIETVDEAAEKLNRVLENNQTYYEITPETEFWGHCSNLQVWAEQNYDTRLIKSDLAFPLLKRLVDAGDLKAQRAFKEELAKRLSSGYYNVIEFLFEQEYTRYLGKEEIYVVISPLLEKLREKNYQVSRWNYKTEMPLLLLRKLVESGDKQAKSLYKEIIVEIIQTNNPSNIEMLYNGNHIKILSREEFWNIFGRDGKVLKEFEAQIMQNKIKTEKGEKIKKDTCYFVLNNGLYYDDCPMMFTFDNGHITGIGVWSDNKNIFKINKIPNNIFQLTFLEKLILSRVGLEEISLGIKRLNSLKFLAVPENLLSSIPKEICSLKLLENLGLGWNHIRIIPECIGGMDCLRRLGISTKDLNEESKILLSNMKKEKKELFIDIAKY
ncbi:MAG: leucine-rich repeat domain-containing protein [Promethearchaeota archaeon]